MVAIHNSDIAIDSRAIHLIPAFLEAIFHLIKVHSSYRKINIQALSPDPDI